MFARAVFRSLATLAVPLTIASYAAPLAGADTEAYLADLYTMGIPVSEVNQSNLIELGQQTCSTALKYPGMQIVDLAMTIAQSRSAYPYDKSRPIVLSALDNLCPEAKDYTIPGSEGAGAPAAPANEIR